MAPVRIKEGAADRALIERLSPTFAAAFLGCRASAAWTLEARRGLRAVPSPVVDPAADLIVARGHAHEAACLSLLRAQHGSVAVVPGGALENRVAATRAAMDRGEPVIYQAALLDGVWIGYADFLVRVEEACPAWAWSYEPYDAKLARGVRAEHALQIAVYGDMLARLQGRPASHGALMLGTGDPDRPFATERFRLEDVRHYVRRVQRRLEAFSADLPTRLVPEPCGYCGKCDWWSACEERWEAEDDLCRVADITRQQRARLFTAGVPTLRLLADLDPAARVAGIQQAALARLAAQARLQHESAASGEGVFETLAAAPGQGFARLPPPDPADLFLDFEGDPMHPGGLEYLCGVLWQAGDEEAEAEDEPVPGHPELRFRAYWAHDGACERRMLVALAGFLDAWFRRHPAAHLYHYAPYEKTALRRLASQHGMMEDEVDALLRGGRMVDLYRVVREAIRVGERSYSIKSLERFYMPSRSTEVTSGGDSLVVYDHYRQTGEAVFLDQIRDYNRDDCLSTLLLRDWLIERGREVGLWPPAPSVDAEAPEEDEAGAAKSETDAQRRAREEREARKAALARDRAEAETALAGEEGVAPGPEAGPDVQARQLMADLLGFHRREDKPVWWAFYDRQERQAEELVEDEECLGACEAAGEDWITREQQSFVFRYCYPEQGTKLREGTQVHLAANGARAGTIAWIDEANGTVGVKRGTKSGELPKRASLIPGGPLDSSALHAAVVAAALDMARGGTEFPHIRALVTREPPRLRGRVAGAPVIASEDRDDPARLLAAAKAAVHALDRSWLVIQGPPGAGKTYTTAHLILSLIEAGRTVGIASNSHKAVENVLTAIEKHADGYSLPAGCIGQKVGGEFEGTDRIAAIGSGYGKLDPKCPIIGGTAWAFSREELRGSRDVLFVDEAGQVSLANLVAMASAAKSVVLVGDQMQLAQPIQGAHPRGSGVSALDHLLEGNAVVPEARGIFLSRTWRMHPDLCSFVSEAVYEGRLASEAGCARQRLVLAASAHPALKPAGLAFHPVAHEGCRQRSAEEAGRTAEILASLLDQRVTDRQGRTRRLTLDDVLVVAPYNMQVNLLRRVLPEGARVGTVDKFQGQEAEVVLVSMATSGAEDMPRDAAFLLSRNRLNVAISRARCLAVLIASPGLLDLVAHTLEEMRLANLFCWAADYAAAGDGLPR